MMRIVLRLILILCLFACPGQATENIFSTYTLFNEKNGLSSRNIKGIQKDGDGYFWLATENDILRFDGSNFIEFKLASRYFSSESVKKIIRAGHYLYIAYEERGLIRMDLNDYSYKLITRLPLADFTLKNENELYWITRNGIVSRLSEGNLTHSVKIQGNEGQIQFFDNKVFVKRKGDPIYILRSTDLRPLKKTTLSVSTNDENFEVGNGRIFYLKNKVLFGFDSTYQPIRIPTFYDSTFTSVTRYKFFSKDLQFYILNRKELWFSQKGVQQRIPMAGLMNYELRDCFVNDPENILICSNQGLLHIRLNTDRNSYINDNVPENESKIRVRRKILETKDSALILTGYPYTFIYGKDSVFRKLTNNIFSTYDAAIEGDWVYAATEGDGLKKINITTGQYITDTTGPLNANDTYYTVQKTTNERMLYIGGQGKIFRYDLKKEKIDVTSLPLANAVVMSIVFHPQSSICWLGTNLGLIRWNEKSNTFKVIRFEEGYGSYEVSDLMIRERQGEIWVAHNHGVDIIDVDDGKLIRQLPSNLFTNPRICSLQEDRDSRVWMSTFSGITGYDPETETFLQLNLSNSLMNLEFNYKSAITRKNGDIVFGGLNGYDIIKPSSYRFTGTKNLGLITGYQRITYDDTVFVKVNSSQPEPIDFYSDVEYLRFYLSSSDIINNSRYSFEYNFNNAPWLKVKGLPYINLVNLEPGNYRLNIRAFNEFGVPISFPEVQILSIVPFYRSPVFFISLTVISLALLLLFIITVLRLRNKEQLLKEQISMDLHDEVGTILTRALYVSKNPHDKNSIRQLHNYLDDALYSLRVYINSMNRRSYSIQELHDEINDMLSVTFRSEHVNLDFSFSHDNDYNIRGSMFRDIKLCLYEIINNALKHADGDHVEIKVFAKNSLLHLSVVDDGKLNDLEGIEERGNGIGNLRKRVERNKGNIHFSIRQPMGGLVIDIEFPLSK